MTGSIQPPRCVGAASSGADFLEVARLATARQRLLKRSPVVLVVRRGAIRPTKLLQAVLVRWQIRRQDALARSCLPFDEGLVFLLRNLVGVHGKVWTLLQEPTQAPLPRFFQTRPS